MSVAASDFMQHESDVVPSLRPAGPWWGVAIALAVIPFFVSVTSRTSVGGTLVYRDYVALGGGILALAFALLCVLVKPRRAGVAGLAFGFGLLHILRGLGLVLALR
jgi:hypothetical protein